MLEPRDGLYRADGNPSELPCATMIPWEMGKQLVWDVTVVDALAPSRLNQGSLCNPGITTTEAEARKIEKCRDCINCILVMILYHSCTQLILTVYFRPKHATSTLQNKVEHIPSWMAKTILSLHIGKTQLLLELLGRKCEKGKYYHISKQICEISGSSLG